MNPVISKKYVEENYIHKDVLREYRDNLKQGKELIKKEDVKIINTVIDILNYILDE